MNKICFLITSLNNSGGTERVTCLISNKLASQGYDVSILSLTNGENSFFNLHKDIETYSIYPKKISFKKNFLGTAWKIRQFVKNNDINTLIVVDSMLCIFTVPALAQLNIKHICWEHFNFNNNNGRKLRDLGRKLAVKYCDYVVTLTKRDKKIWEQKLKTIKANIVSISNPSPFENIKNIPSTDFKVMLSVGRLTHVKGFDILIEAWAKVCQTNTDWMLRIVGSGEEEEALKNQANVLDISDRIEFIPATKKIDFYYQTSSFYCLSSRFEGFPMVLLEAQAFSLPIVAFDCDTGPSELVENDINGYLCANGNLKSLTLGIYNLINSSEEKFAYMCHNAKLNSEYYTLLQTINKWKVIL